MPAAPRHFYQPPAHTPLVPRTIPVRRSACGAAVYSHQAEGERSTLLGDLWTTQFESKTTCPECLAALETDGDRAAAPELTRS